HPVRPGIAPPVIPGAPGAVPVAEDQSHEASNKGEGCSSSCCPKERAGEVCQVGKAEGGWGEWGSVRFPVGQPAVMRMAGGLAAYRGPMAQCTSTGRQHPATTPGCSAPCL
ncbi:hypothetical protein HaLaN_31800, partial [Haematococcus lacustris]